MTPDEIKAQTERLEKAAEARRIKYPITVEGIDFDVKIGVSKDGGWLSTTKPGTFVAVRSCKEEHGDKTRLGIVIGYVPIHAGVEHHKETNRLKFYLSGDNPAIFVFELNEVVLGCGSWWSEIESEVQLREISNNDIQNAWYVKALKQLMDKPSKGGPKRPPVAP